jgi:serine acetyltransferase
VIGHGVKIGQGAVFKPRVHVGDRAVIGAGAVVTKNVPAGETWVGNPARRLVRATGEQLTPSEEAGWEQLAAANCGRDGYEEWAAWWDRSRSE